MNHEMDEDDYVTDQADGFAEAARVSAENETAHKQSSRSPRCFTEKMPCKLSSSELLELGDHLAKLSSEADQLEAERKDSNDGYKARIALVEQAIKDGFGTLRSKHEMREVELVEEFIFATNTAIVARVDTGAVVRERALTRSERQEELPLEKKDAKPADSTEIADPQAVLEGKSAPEGDRTPKKVTRQRKGAKA